MELHYMSTRGDRLRMTAGQAILRGIAPDGGLYVPERIPAPDKALDELIQMSYRDLAFEILNPFLPDFSEELLRKCISNAYSVGKFDTESIAPVVEKGSYYFLELFHGPTLAFKDMALSILPHLLTASAALNGEEKQIVILTATSGDTGKAALEGFSEAAGVDILVFFPEDGVSNIQKRQMVTQEGDNTFVVGVKGNFDDTQNGVKAIFTNEALRQGLEKKGYVFSSANSINIGRLLPQVVYYFYAYGQMVKNGAVNLGEKINFTVPTGNFGNILAGYYAHLMGLPIGRLLCASNENKVLFDFFQTGRYDKNRPFVTTSSPSMDILISSNLERYLYHLSDDALGTKSCMDKLWREGAYDFDGASGLISGEYATEGEGEQAIKEMCDKGYVMDPHTAVAYAAYRKYVEKTGDNSKNVIVATASPYKFPEAVCGAIGALSSGMDDEFGLMETLSQMSHVPVPEAIRQLKHKPIRHKTVCAPDEMEKTVIDYLTCADKGGMA